MCRRDRSTLAARVTKPRRAAAYHRGDCVLEDQLFLRVVLEQYRILIEGTYLACQLYTADEVDGDGAFVLADRIQEGILNVLCRLGIHGPISSYHRTQPFLDIPRQGLAVEPISKADLHPSPYRLRCFPTRAGKTDCAWKHPENYNDKDD
jgi:hypothetical protein